ncbi:hypothetical protein IGI04_016787, partial [Brassica rapa subsp. trilocularis]
LPHSLGPSNCRQERQSTNGLETKGENKKKEELVEFGMGFELLKAETSFTKMGSEEPNQKPIQGEVKPTATKHQTENKERDKRSGPATYGGKQPIALQNRFQLLGSNEESRPQHNSPTVVAPLLESNRPNMTTGVSSDLQLPSITPDIETASSIQFGTLPPTGVQNILEEFTSSSASRIAGNVSGSDPSSQSDNTVNNVPVSKEELVEFGMGFELLKAETSFTKMGSEEPNQKPIQGEVKPTATKHQTENKERDKRSGPATYGGKQPIALQNRFQLLGSNEEVKI